MLTLIINRGESKEFHYTNYENFLELECSLLIKNYFFEKDKTYEVLNGRINDVNVLKEIIRIIKDNKDNYDEKLILDLITNYTADITIDSLNQIKEKLNKDNLTYFEFETKYPMETRDRRLVYGYLSTIYEDSSIPDILLNHINYKEMINEIKIDWLLGEHFGIKRD